MAVDGSEQLTRPVVPVPRTEQRPGPAARAASPTPWARWVPLAAAVTFTLVFIAWTRLRLGGAAVSADADQVLSVIAAGLAAAACWRVQRRVPAVRSAWRFAGAACAAWALGTLTTLLTGAPVTRAGRGFGVEDVFYLAAIPLAVLAVYRFPTAPVRGAQRARVALDGLVIACSLATLAWLSVVADLVSDHPHQSAASVAVGVGYPFVEVLIASLALLAVSRSGREAVPMWLAAAGVTVLAATNLTEFWLAEHGRYRTGNPVDVGFVIGFLLIGLGTFARQPSSRRPPDAPAGRLLPLMLPYAPAVLACADVVAHHRIDTVGVAMAVAVFLLVIARQMVSLLDNEQLTRAVARRESYYRALVAGSSDLTMLVDRHGVIRYCSPSALELLADGDGTAPTRLTDVVHESDLPAVRSALARCIRQGRRQVVVYRVWHAQGLTAYLETAMTNLLDHPAVAGVVLNSRDVTANRAAQLALAASEERYRRMVEVANEGIWVTDADDVITFVNNQATEMIGLLPEDVIGRTTADVFTPMLDDVSRTALAQNKKRRVSGHRDRYEFSVTRADGVQVHGWVSATPLFDAEGRYEGSLTMVSDISERKRLEVRLLEQAYRDPLTGLANRTLFHDRVRQALARASRADRPAAVMFCDLDSFKAVNDSLGHYAGDLLLTAVAQRLGTCIREGDTICRLGGDEFAVLLEEPGAHPAEAEHTAVEVAERMLSALAIPFDVAGRDVYINGSIGIAFSADGVDGDALMRNADLAMYRAKVSGRGRYQLFEASMHERAMSRVALESDLRRALSHDQLVVHYQPVVSLDTGACVGVEALVRWRHPLRGLVEPDEFIPVAEESGLIIGIGGWVLREACRQVADWQQEFRQELSVGVNVSARQLTDPDLPAYVAGVLSDTRLAGRDLVVEITERSFVEGQTARGALEGLRALGVQIALDDFGTGYSSLSYLRHFPVDLLKIDRSYVSGLGVTGELTTLTETVVRLGGSLGLTTVAEGIETDGQRRSLLDMGCRLAQGYLFSRPLPPAEFRAWLQAWTAATPAGAHG